MWDEHTPTSRYSSKQQEFKLPNKLQHELFLCIYCLRPNLFDCDFELSDTKNI